MLNLFQWIPGLHPLKPGAGAGMTIGGLFYDGYYFYRHDDFLWAHFLGIYCFVFKSIRKEHLC